jgi:hypothetical protein
MKTIVTACGTLLGAVLLAGGPAAADDRCGPRQAAGICAPLHFIDDDFSRSELLRQRAYERGYRDGRRGYKEVAPPPDIALDGKAGYSQSYSVHRQYLDRHGNRRDDSDRGNYGRDEYDEYYERRLRRNDAGEVIDFATEVLRGLSN